MASRIDLTTRADPATLPELMDEPCSYEELQGCLRDLASVNRWTLAYRPTLHFIAEAVRRRAHAEKPLRILDVGSGGGDTLRRIAAWAARRRLKVELTGIDINPHATRAAQEFPAKNSGAAARFAEIRWINGDAFTEPAAQQADLIISSLVTHHMGDAGIVQFLRWMEDTAREGWFINDLLRSARAYRIFGVLAKLMHWHSFVQHDGPVSIRRAFRADDWRRLLAEAGVPLTAVSIAQPIPGRLCLTRLR